MLKLGESRVRIKSLSGIQEPEQHLGAEVMETWNDTETVIHQMENFRERMNMAQGGYLRTSTRKGDVS